MNVKKSDTLNAVISVADKICKQYKSTYVTQLHFIAALIDVYLDKKEVGQLNEELTKSVQLLNIDNEKFPFLYNEIIEYYINCPKISYREAYALRKNISLAETFVQEFNDTLVTLDLVFENLTLGFSTDTERFISSWRTTIIEEDVDDELPFDDDFEESAYLDTSDDIFIPDILESTKTLQNILRDRVYGQDEAISAIVSGYFHSLVRNKQSEDSQKPMATFLFAGAPGVGKTYLAQMAAQALRLPFRRFDMSSFADKEATLEFSGSDKVYRSSHEGLVTGFVKDHPRCVLLFDEIEKAHINIIHLFLQILDAGVLKDSHTGKNVSFKDTIIIMTTNVGKSLYENLEPGAPMPSRKVIVNALSTEINPTTKTMFFPQAICSRFAAGNIVLFNPLGAQELLEICDLAIDDYTSSFFKKYDLFVSTDEKLSAALLFSEGGKVDARTLKGRTINFLSSEIYNWLKFASERNAISVSDVKDMNINVIPQDDTISLFSPEGKQYVLLFSEKDDTYSQIKEEENFEFLFATTKKQAEDYINQYDISFAVCDIFGSAKATLNIEDIASDGRKLLDVLVNERIPTYIYCSPNHIINSEERQALLENGAYGFFDLNDSDLCFKPFATINLRVHTEKMLRELARSKKVLTFDCVYNYDEKFQKAVIDLTNLRIIPAIDGEDQNDIVGITATNTTFDSIIGAENAKAELKGFMEYLKKPKAYAKKGIPAPKGVMLYGPPGTGKTMLAKALAHESGAAFIATQGNAFLSPVKGAGAAEVRRLFALARKYAPSVLFIDEVDIIAKDRMTDGTADDVINAFLNEMDGFSTNPTRPVFVLAATNFDVTFGQRSALDPAFLRRFDRRIFVDLPDKNDRLTFIKTRLEKCNQLLDDSITENIALRSTGMSLAELESVIDFSLRSMVQKGYDSLTNELFDEAFETYRYGEKTIWSKELLSRIAIHEAGHAFISYLCGDKPLYITVSGRSNFGGYSHFSAQEQPSCTKPQLLGEIRKCLAGRAAEMVFLGMQDGVSTGAAQDIKCATDIALKMITVYGMIDDHGIMSYLDAPPNEDITRLCNEMLDAELDNAVNLITQNKECVQTLIDALIKKNYLIGDEIKEILINARS